MINDKKGQALSINTIIITILAIFVLVIIVVAVTGGFGNFSKWIGEIFGSQAIDAQAAVLKCDGFCTGFDSTGAEQYKRNFCDEVFEIDSTGDGEIDVELTCPEMTQVSCTSISC
jgi:hypothetical protein